MKAQSQEKGFLGAMKAFFPYMMKFVFGKRGLGVTVFNYAAPILSVVFLFNVISYATSATFSLKLTVNGKFIGYIESEQDFLNAEALVLQRVNYFGSDNTIEISSEFAIANAGSSELLTPGQVANAIIEASDFTPVSAIGFFIDDVCYGAVLKEDKPVIDKALQALLDDSLQELLDDLPNGASDEDVSFYKQVQFDSYELFLEDSIVKPEEIISMINSTSGDGEPYLPVVVTLTEIYEVASDFETITQPNDNLFEGTTREAHAGVRGVNQVEARVSLLNGEEKSRSIVNTTVITPPVDRVIHTGTRPRDNKSVSPQPGTPGMFVWPTLMSGYISQNYFSGHGAVDIAGSSFHGTPVYAAGSGIVTEVHYLSTGYGYYIVIQHGEEYDNLKTLYSHCNEIIVTVGQEVIQGEQIGTVGRTGRADGSHLHFEVIDGNRRLNPNNYISKG